MKSVSIVITGAYDELKEQRVQIGDLISNLKKSELGYLNKDIMI